MKAHPITSSQYQTIDRHMSVIKNRLCLDGGSPIDPAQLIRILGALVEGRDDSAVGEDPPVIDCMSAPPARHGLRYASDDQLPGAVKGTVAFDLSRIVLRLAPGQKNGVVKGDDLRKHLAVSAVLPAHIPEFLCRRENHRLIPPWWRMDGKGAARCVIFWGSIFHSGQGTRYVRGLTWDFDRPATACFSLGCDFGERCPAVVLE